MFDGFHDVKTHHTATGDKISLVVFKTGITASLTCIHKKNLKAHFDRKMIHKLGWCTATWVGERTARACVAHFLDV
jgi:hypothetical protein